MLNLHAPNLSVNSASQPYETVAHFLFERPTLDDIKKIYLPPSPELNNTLYANKRQLQKTCMYMANSQTDKTQMTAGFEK